MSFFSFVLIFLSSSRDLRLLKCFRCYFAQGFWWVYSEAPVSALFAPQWCRLCADTVVQSWVDRSPPRWARRQGNPPVSRLCRSTSQPMLMFSSHIRNRSFVASSATVNTKIWQCAGGVVEAREWLTGLVISCSGYPGSAGTDILINTLWMDRMGCFPKLSFIQ